MRPRAILLDLDGTIFRNGLLPAEKILMVGDDIEGDIGGALNAGMKSILVKTGKFWDETLRFSDIEPNYAIDSIADFPYIIDLV